MKLLKVFMISMLTFILIGSSAFAATGKVTGNKVRIREKADSNSKELSIATQGEKVEVIGEEGDWYKVNFEKYTGYMSKEYIDTDYSGDSSASSELVSSTTPDPGVTPEPDNTVTETPNVLEPENTSQVDNAIETQEPTPPVEQTPTPEEPSTSETVPDSNEEYQVGESVTFSEETSLKYLPNFASREISKAEKDSTYNVILVLNKWIKVSDDTNSGWILSSKINKNAGEETSSTETNNPVTSDEQQPSESTRKGTINVESARVRVEPDGESLGYIKEGTEVTILGEEGDWLHIRTDEYNDCYIAKRLITEK